MTVVTRSRSHANAQRANEQTALNAAVLAHPRLPPRAAVPTLPIVLPHDNLQSYVRSVRVSSPVFGRNIPAIYRGTDRITPKDRHLLSIELDSRFRLREVWLSKPPMMADRVKKCLRNNLPTLPIPDPESRGVTIRTANFSLEAPGYMTFIDPPSPVDDILGLANLTMRILETAERVVNLVWPEESKGLKFTFPDEYCSSVSEVDASLCIPLYYQKVREQDLVKVTEPKVKLVVVVLAPWAVATSDIREMLSIKNALLPTNGSWSTCTRAQKIWAQIFQCCASQNCPFFILTTYDQWLFGAFHTASGWSQVVITTTVSHTTPQPTILEWVVFWCVSALKINGGWIPSLSPPSNKNPEIAHSGHLQPVESSYNHMSDEEWIRTLEFNSRNDPPLPVASKIEGLSNVYITHFD